MIRYTLNATTKGYYESFDKHEPKPNEICHRARKHNGIKIIAVTSRESVKSSVNRLKAYIYSGSHFWLVTFYVFTADQCLTNPGGASRGSGAFVSKPKQCPHPAGQFFFSKIHHSPHVPGGFPGVSPGSTPGKANDKCISAYPPHKIPGSFTAFNINVRVEKINHMHTKFRQIVHFQTR